MKAELVDTRMKQLVQHVEHINSMVAYLKEYPIEYIRTNLKGRTGSLGARSFYWLVCAIESLYDDLEKKSLFTKADLSTLNAYFVRDLKYRDKRKSGLFWFISAGQAYATLVRLNQRFRDYGLQHRFEILTRGYQRFAKHIHDRIGQYETILDDDFNFYMVYFAEAALKAQKPFGRGTFSKRLCQVAFDKLERELANFVSAPAISNQIALSISALLTADTVEKVDQSEDSLMARREAQIKKAAEICFERGRRFFIKRLIVPNELALHNLPWEELFILTELKPKYLPNNLEIVEDVLKYFDDRLIKQHGIVGLVEESSPQFPTPSPYFTFYSIVLLKRFERMLKEKLKSMLICNVGSIDPESIKKPSTELKLHDQEILDTQENTYAYLRDLFPMDLGACRANIRKHNTMLFFGPPGTGKTTIVEVLTNHFNDVSKENERESKWEMITFTPRVFLTVDSYGELIEQIADLFSVLAHVDHCIFFFDEAEELVRSREGEGERFSRMFTASMLIYLNRLKHSSSVFVFATNYINKMDQAAIRKGRFAVRKGLGWVSDEELDSFVMRKFRAYGKERQKFLQRLMRGMPASQIMEIHRKIKTKFKKRRPSMASLEGLLKRQDSIIPFEARSTHLENCREFDNEITPRKRGTALRARRT